MGLYSGFKSECISQFPEGWVHTCLKFEQNLVHVIDGMCVFHRFIPNDAEELVSDMDQLSEFFVNVMTKELFFHGGNDVVLVFDITDYIPSTKSDELSKRNSASNDGEIVSWGDLTQGILPRPWTACLSDRTMRMNVIDRLCESLIDTMRHRYRHVGFTIYGWKDGAFFFTTSSQLDELKGVRDIKVFGEADVSMAYIASVVDRNPVAIHTVDTDLVAIASLALGSKSKNTYVCLSHHDVKSGQRVTHISGAFELNKSIESRTQLRPDDFFMICMLQGTDFVERLIKRGSWKTLFEYIKKKSNENRRLINLTRESMCTEIDDKFRDSVRRMLFDMSPKTIAASEGSKRRKLVPEDIFVSDFSLKRMLWNINYWKFAIHVGYDPIRASISSGWIEKNDRIAMKIS